MEEEETEIKQECEKLIQNKEKYEKK